MGKRNIYKDIVVVGILAFGVFFLAGKGKAWLQEPKTYSMMVQSGEELTEGVRKELQKISGISRFEPVDTVALQVKMGEYTLETEVMGVELEAYPLKWEKAEPEIRLGNTLMLLVGKECFGAFLDGHGYSPTKGEIEKWIKGYAQLELTVADQEGRSKKAKICGILKEPGGKMCMEKGQFQEAFGGVGQVKGGYMEVLGAQNAKKAQELLEGAGFQVEAL